MLGLLELALHTGSCEPLRVGPENRTRSSAKAGEHLKMLLTMELSLWSPLHCDHLQIKSYA